MTFSWLSFYGRGKINAIFLAGDPDSLSSRQEKLNDLNISTRKKRNIRETMRDLNILAHIDYDFELDVFLHWSLTVV